MLGILAGLHLANHNCARRFDRWNKRRRIAKRQKNCARRMLQNAIKQLRLLGERPCNKPATNRCIACCLKLAVNPIAIAVPAANQPERARIRDGCRKFTTRCKRHRRRNDRMLQVQCFG